MIAKIILGSAAAAFAWTGLAAAPAQAHYLPTYHCGRVFGGHQETIGAFQCVARNGARPEGPFFGPAVIRSHSVAWLCAGPGIALIPRKVASRQCRPIG